MALRWDYRCKAGYLTYVQPPIREGESSKAWTITLYEGNAFLIALYEYENDKGEKLADLQWFFLDEFHAKRCLGLAKSADGTKHCMFEPDSMVYLRLHRDHCANWAKIAELFTKVFPHITVRITEHEVHE